MSRLSFSSERTCHFFAAAVLFVATTAAYLPGLTAPFLFDDHIIRESEEFLRAPWAATWEGLENQRPVVFLSLSLNYALGAFDVRGYHVVNLLVHLVAGLTLFGIVRRTLCLPLHACKYGTRANVLAFAIALLWLVHPLQTQAVTYTIQRCESMMGMFYLLALYALLRGSQSLRPWPWYLGSLASGWLGMGCKEVMITAPVLLLIFDRVFLSPSWKAVLQRRWLFYLGFAPAMFWLTANSVGRVENHAGFGCIVVSPLEYLRSQPGVILHYLRLAAFPDRLCFDYGWPVATTWQEILVPTAIVIAMGVASLVALRYRPALGFLGIAFFLILSPTSSFAPIADLAFEHRMYLPLATVVTLGVFGARAAILVLVRRRPARRFLLATSLAIAVVLLMGRTAVRNTLYRSPTAMWANVVSVAPHNVRAHHNYGKQLAHHRQTAEAIHHFRKIIELKADHVDARLDLATLLAREGKPDEAIEQFRRALALNPAVAAAHYNLGILLFRQGDLDAALAHFRTAAALKPEKAVYRDMLDGMQARAGNQPEAIGSPRI